MHSVLLRDGKIVLVNGVGGSSLISNNSSIALQLLLTPVAITSEVLVPFRISCTIRCITFGSCVSFGIR